MISGHIIWYLWDDLCCLRYRQVMWKKKSEETWEILQMSQDRSRYQWWQHKVYDSLWKLHSLIMVEKYQKLYYRKRNKTKILKNRKKKSVCSWHIHVLPTFIAYCPVWLVFVFDLFGFFEIFCSFVFRVFVCLFL